jgi:hypothetical protein
MFWRGNPPGWSLRMPTSSSPAIVSELEDYVARPRLTGVLVLEAKTSKYTRLYKQVAANGLVVECGARVRRSFEQVHRHLGPTGAPG